MFLLAHLHVCCLFLYNIQNIGNSSLVTATERVFIVSLVKRYEIKTAITYIIFYPIFLWFL